MPFLRLKRISFMLRRLVRISVFLLPVLLVLGCDIKGFDRYSSWNGEILVMQLGYMGHVEGSGRNFDYGGLINPDDAQFIAYYSKEDYEKAQEQAEKSEFKDFELPYNRIDFSGHLITEETDIPKMEVQVFPKGVNLKSVDVVSSDPEILYIYKVEGSTIWYIPLKLGDVELKVTAHGALNSVEATYPFKVIIPMPVNFYITPYWLNSLADTRVRFTFNNAYEDEQVRNLVCEVKDSVTVIGYCEWYDFHKSRKPNIIRDTITYRTDDFLVRYQNDLWKSKRKKYLLRNITDAVKEFRSRHVSGNKYATINVNGSEMSVIIPWEYYWVPEQVIVDQCIVSNNPYIYITSNTKCYKSFTHLVDDDGQEYETDTDSDIYDESEDTPQEQFSNEEISYFSVYLNTLTSESEYNSMMEDLQSTLDRFGYDETLSDEEKDEQLEKINSHKKEGE